MTAFVGMTSIAFSATESATDHLAVATARKEIIVVEKILACSPQSQDNANTMRYATRVTGSMRLESLVRRRRVSLARAEVAAATWLNAGAVAEVQSISAKFARTRGCSGSVAEMVGPVLEEGNRLRKERAPTLFIPPSDRQLFRKRRAEACVAMAIASMNLGQKNQRGIFELVHGYVVNTCRKELLSYEIGQRLGEGESAAQAKSGADAYLSTPRSLKDILRWAQSAHNWMLVN